MKNKSSKFSNINDASNKVIEEVFGFLRNKKEEEPGYVYEDDFIVIDTSHRLIFKNSKSTIEKLKPNYGAWTEIDWRSSNFNWMVNSKFSCKLAEIKGRGDSREVYRFDKCIWGSGTFEGNKFLSGDFKGGGFMGQFGPNSSWETNPERFIQGTTKEVGKILGLKDISDYSKTGDFNFNMIAIVPGNKLTVTLESGIVHQIIVTKRLDDKSSLFSYKVVNGESDGSAQVVNISWRDIRASKGEGQYGFKDNTVFTSSKVPAMLTDMMNLSFNSKVVKVEVGASKSFEKPQYSEKEKSNEEIGKVQKSFDLVDVDFLGIDEVPNQKFISIPGKKGKFKNTRAKAFFGFNSPEQLKGFENTVKNIKNTVLRRDLNFLRSYLDNEIVSGVPSTFPYLASVVGVDKDSLDKFDENGIGSLNRIESFVRDFIDAMVMRARKGDKVFDIPNKEAKELAKDRLKAYLGMEVENTEEEGEVEPKPEVEPKVREPKFENSKIDGSIILERFKKIIDNL